MKKEVEEIIDYIKVTTQDNTSKEKFHRDMEKYDLVDILEAFSVIKEEEDETK